MLESEGGGSNPGSHWEESQLGPEVMTPVENNRINPISDITLAFFEDSGWY